MGLTRKEKLLGGLDLSCQTGAEIGALCNPLLTKSEAGIKYIDYADAAALRKVYAGNPLVDPERIVETDAIWGGQTLLEALERPVDFILASHVVEHVPDLITWLNELRLALTERGDVRLAVPDKRFTFDFLRRETELSDVLAAYLLAPRVPQPREILDYFLNATVVDTEAAWKGEVSAKTLKRPNTFEPAMAKARDAVANGTYHDAHCWVFTPHTFAQLFGQLAKHELIHFACAQYHDTEQHSIEFFVVLRNSNDAAQNVASWRAMEEATCPKDSADIIEALRATEEALRKSQEEILHLRDMQDALEKSREEVRLLRQSSSWRVTAPLRQLSTKVRGLKR